MRKAITLTQAIGVILLVSFLLIITLKQASITAQHTADSYDYQRAELFSNTAVEMALLAIHSYDRNASNDCLENITVEDDNFDANVTVLRYYLHEDDLTNRQNWCGSLEKEILTDESNGMVWLKVSVSPKQSYNQNKTINFVKTTLQKL